MDDDWIKEMLKEQKIYDRLSVNDIKKVYKKLIEVARKGKQKNGMGIIFYGEIMDIVGLDGENAYDREVVLGRMLGGISEHEDKGDKPLLSAVVVLKDGKIPAKGFYGFNDTLMSNEEFWFKEIRKVWDYWSKH